MRYYIVVILATFAFVLGIVSMVWPIARGQGLNWWGLLAILLSFIVYGMANFLRRRDGSTVVLDETNEL